MCASLVAAVTSNRLATQVRAGAEAEIAQAHARAARAATAAGATADRRAEDLARDKADLEHVLARTADLGPDRPGATDAATLERRALAFAALIRSRTPELALIVGHGPGDHAAGVAMRSALKGAGVTVRWCRLKPGVAMGAAPASDLAVYADPDGPHALPMVKALQAVGFKTELLAAQPGERGLPRPAIVLAATRHAPTVAELATCNPVLGDGPTATARLVGTGSAG